LTKGLARKTTAARHPALVGFAVLTDAASGESVGIVGNLGDTPLAVAIDGIDDLSLETGAVRRVAIRVALRKAADAGVCPG
jgi:hypothetical protein